MRFIIYAWGSYSDFILKEKLGELGYEVVVFLRKCEHYTKDLKFAQELIGLIHNYSADAVISVDYFPIISSVCNTVGIRYYSWVYDTPHYTMYAKTSMYRCNRIGCFDRLFVERLNSLGFDTVFHLPLGVAWNETVNAETTGVNGNTLITAYDRVDKDAYACDVSFIGSLYTDKYNYLDDLHIDNSVKDRAYQFIEKQCFEYINDYMYDFFRDADGDINEDLLDSAKKVLEENELLPGNEYIEDVEYIFISSLLEKKVTVEERKRLLRNISAMGYDFRLYTGSDLSMEPALQKKNRGYVDYKSVMPIIFEQSKINLNISLRSIHSGIPLRAMDIMGCGGFLLSNYQEELGESFKEGKEMEMFRSREECLDKIRYYLTHEEERLSIAAEGYRAVNERFDYKKQLNKLILCEESKKNEN